MLVANPGVPMERLTAEDQLMLWPDEIWPQDIGALAVLDGSSLLDPGGRFRIEAVREAVAARLHVVPRFPGPRDRGYRHLCRRRENCSTTSDGGGDVMSAGLSRASYTSSPPCGTWWPRGRRCANYSQSGRSPQPASTASSARTAISRSFGPASIWFKEVAHTYGATVNDVLLTVTAGGLRGLLASRGEPVDVSANGLERTPSVPECRMCRNLTLCE
jgi:hypothetical protein